MKALFATLLLAGGLHALAQEAPAPEMCRVITDARTAVTVAHAGRTYRLADEACRVQFLSDPERYAQLYDALAELEAAGKAAVAPAPSLVPS